MIAGNVIGVNPITPKAVVLETADGIVLRGVAVDEKTIFTATENDIREGKTAGTEQGVITGQKVIPAYHTTEGYKLVLPGKEVSLLFANECYEYTKLQVIICPFNTTYDNSVSAEKVAINDGVYNVNSTQLLANVTLDHENKKIKLGITNDSDLRWVVRYFTYKEEY